MFIGRFFSTSRRRSLVALVVLVGLITSACTGSATIDEDAAPVEPTPPAESAATEVEQQEPTAVPVTPEPVTPEPGTPTSPPDSESDPDRDQTVPFRSDSLLGISPEGTHVFAATTSRWQNPTPCGAPAAESLAVRNILSSSVDHGGMGSGGGLAQGGDVRQLVIGLDSRAAILSSCGPNEAPTFWLHTATVSADGHLLDVEGPLLLANPDNESDPFLVGWSDESAIELQVVVEVDPDDLDASLIEYRRVSAATGEVVSVEQFPLYDELRFPVTEFVTDAGFTYRVVADPQGRLGCEGYGVARTIEVDDGSGPRPAFGSDHLVFSDVSNLHVASTGHIAWTSNCEGFTTAFVGKVQPDGSIVDAHFVDTFTDVDQAFVEYRYYRLTEDGFLVAAGLAYETGSNDPDGVQFLRHDLASDPAFVMTANPPPAIDDEPLFGAVRGDGAWHVGETLGTPRACGGQTLYRNRGGEFSRAFPVSVELDAIVDVDLGETLTTTYDEGDDYVSRTVVVSTVCPGEYEGHRVWFGTEDWTVRFSRADMDEVRQVLSVRDELEEGTQFVQRSLVEVELLDGTIAEVELAIRQPPS